MLLAAFHIIVNEMHDKLCAVSEDPDIFASDISENYALRRGLSVVISHLNAQQLLSITDQLTSGDEEVQLY